MMNQIHVTLSLVVAISGLVTFTALRAQEPTPVVATSCDHGIDKAKCPFCDPSRIERLGMCKEHGVPEAMCVSCKPYLKVAFVAVGDWCIEHDKPESQCSQCDPTAAKAANDHAQSAGAELRWQREPSLGCVTSSATIALASVEAARAAGFEFAMVQAGPLEHVVERNAEVAYNANRYARLSSRAGGIVTEVLKDLGETVRKGDILAIVDSNDLGMAKAELLQAIATVNLWTATAARRRGLLEKGVGTERDVFEAESTLTEARIAHGKASQRLRTLGLSNEQVEQVGKDADTSSLLTVTASFDGMVVESSAVMGEVVEPGKPILSIADIGVMWAMVDLAEADLAVVKVGQRAAVSVDGLPGKSFAGRLTWISTQVDPKSRTIKARVELDNGEGLLRANMFGRARINAGDSRTAMTIPKEAVQWEGCCNIAFVKADPEGTTFQPVRLVLGFDAGDQYEVAHGLKPGDMIVTKGSFILKNEILKNSVGAGCCEVDHLKK